MNNKDLEKIKNEYKGLLVIKKENLKLIDRKEELEKMSVVKEYLNILNILEGYKNYSFYKVENLTEDEILTRAVSSVRISDASNYYVCLNTKDKNKNVVSHDDKNASVSSYLLLENFDIKTVEISEREKFEKENVIIYVPKNKEPFNFYRDIKKNYFKKAVFEGKEASEEYISEVSKKYSLK